MIDYYLKFTSEAQANEALTITLIDTVSNIYPNTSTIGIVYKPTGALDTEGNRVMQPTEGWHVNVRTTGDVPELEQYRTYPSTPIRVWG
jgi:hypothetical protein